MDISAPAATYSPAEIEEATKAAQHGSGPFPELSAKEFSFLSIVGLAFAILNSWTAMAASLSIALPSGGPTAVIWGILPSTIGNLAMAASLAEICHVYPTSGGQYHWSFVLAPPKYAPLISWTTGWFSVAGWWALMGTAGSLGGSLFTGQISLVNPGYVFQRWHLFLLYTAITFSAMVMNIWGTRLLPLVNKAALIWSLTGATTICIVCLACASPNYQPATFVFTEFINETGWNGGVAWMLGLLQSTFGLTAFDAVSHMVEEMPNPRINAPKAMVLAVFIGASSSFVFLTVLLFCINDVEGVITSSGGALLGAMYQATGSVTAAVCLLVFPLVSILFAGQGILTVSSRMTYAFARDGGLPFSPFFATMSPNGVPNNAVYLTTVLVMLFGLIYLGSSSALNAILSSSVVFLNISYVIPIGLVLFRGRHLLRPASFPEPTLTLGPILGPITNAVGLAFAVVTTVFFLFPPVLPVTALNMNYAVVVFLIIFIVSAITWFVTGSKKFIGPRDLGVLLELARAEVEEGPEVKGPSKAATIAEAEMEKEVF